MTMKKSLNDYLGLKYRIELLPDEAGGYYARHPELRGCGSVGETTEEAIANLSDAREAWITARYEEGLSVPEPTAAEEASGRVLLRMPPWLHSALMRRAAEQGTSLNQTAVTILSRACGYQEAESQVAETIRAEFVNLRAALGVPAIENNARGKAVR